MHKILPRESDIIEKISAQLCCEGSGIGISLLYGKSHHYYSRVLPVPVAVAADRCNRDIPRQLCCEVVD